jgi:hypothetical protein
MAMPRPYQRRRPRQTNVLVFNEKIIEMLQRNVIGIILSKAIRPTMNRGVMVMHSPTAGTFGAANPAHSPTLCLSLGQEVRRVAFGETSHGDGMIWLLAQLTADRREVSLPRIIRRLGVALMASNGPMVWEYARSEVSDADPSPQAVGAANDATPSFPPDSRR